MSQARIKSLDGLRGVAAVVVVISHAMLTSVIFADSHFKRHGLHHVDAAWFVTYTPLHVFWAGDEAVYLFFVLSGVVLTLPLTNLAKKFSWLNYYPRRLLRLYLPVFAAVILGGTLIHLIRRFNDPGLGPWINRHPDVYTTHAILHDVTLIFGTTHNISPLWSLRWEVLFSLLLPIYVFAAIHWRRIWWVKILVIFVAVGFGAATGNQFAFYLPIFAIGAVFAIEWSRLGEALRPLDQRRFAWATFILVGIVLTTAKWTARGLGVPARDIKYLGVIPVVGVCLLVLAGGFHGATQRLLTRRTVLWLGKVSFALYLVHEPILVSARFLAFPSTAWMPMLLAIPVAFAVAALFTKLVEQPSHRFARAVGKYTQEHVHV